MRMNQGGKRVRKCTACGSTGGRPHQSRGLPVCKTCIDKKVCLRCHEPQELLKQGLCSQCDEELKDQLDPETLAPVHVAADMSDRSSHVVISPVRSKAYRKRDVGAFFTDDDDYSDCRCAAECVCSNPFEMDGQETLAGDDGIAEVDAPAFVTPIHKRITFPSERGGIHPVTKVASFWGSPRHVANQCRILSVTGVQTGQAVRA